MLKKILVVLLISLVLTSCEIWSPETATIENNPFSYDVTISQNADVYKYRLSYKDGYYKFLPVDNTLPIEFIYRNDEFIAKCGGNEFIFSDKVTKPLPVVIANVIDLTLGKEISADNNGAFKFYGNTDKGEFSLTVDADGKLLFLTLKNIDLAADFTPKGGTVWKTDS